MVIVGALLIEIDQAAHHFFQGLLIISYLVLHRMLYELECGAELADENRPFFFLNLHFDWLLARVPVAEGQAFEPDFPPAIAHAVYLEVLLEVI